MKFLVEIAVNRPPGMSKECWDDLRQAEVGRGRELREAGAIEAIWRIPGTLRNVGVWEARDATELHELLASLPLFPYLDAEVTALARHTIDSPSDD